MKRLVSNKDFPSANNFTYLNTANVGLMHKNAEKEINKWVEDLAKNGSNIDNLFSKLNMPVIINTVKRICSPPIVGVPVLFE